MNQELVLVRYDNRVMYSKAEKRYVTGRETFTAFKAGVTVRVTSHRTGNDITSAVLDVLFKTYYKFSPAEIKAYVSSAKV